MEPFFRDPFVATLRELGYVEGRDINLVIRSANNIPEHLPALAAELVHLNVDVIVTGGDSEVVAAKQATRTIPIVMAPSGEVRRMPLENRTFDDRFLYFVPFKERPFSMH